MRLGVAAAAAAGLALACNEASAIDLGSFGTSAGIFTALSAVLLSRSWPSGSVPAGWSAMICASMIAAGGAWVWRLRAGSRLSKLAPASSEAAGALPLQPGFEVPLPPGLSRAEFLKELRLHFVSLQAAWDCGEMESLRGLATPEMLREFSHLEQDCVAACGRHCTDVVLLRANLLSFEDLKSALLVTVEFSGLMRERPERGADPFRELWMLTKSKHAADRWRLARHQALL